MTHPRVANKVIPCKDPPAVAQGIKNARQMLLSTNKRLREGGMGIGVTDPHTPLETYLMGLFRVEPGNRSIDQIQTIKEHFRLLEDALTNVTPVCVSSDCDDCKKGDAFAYPEVAKQSTIYICPSWFDKSPVEQAELIIHELVHARLGAPGGEKIFSVQICETPTAPPDVKDFEAAVKNPYVYDAFAYCASQLPAPVIKQKSKAGH